MLKNSYGFLLVEILVAVGIMSVIFLVISKTLDISLVSSNVVKSILIEQDLKTALYRTLTGEQCKKNLHPDRLNSITVPSLIFWNNNTPGAVLIEKGSTFKEMLEIVEIELADTSVLTQKELNVFFKKKSLKHLNTKDRKVCNEADKSGCYKNSCIVEHDFSDPTDIKCELLDCFSGNQSSQVIPPITCYSENNGLLIGCGDVQSIGGDGTVAIGHDMQQIQIDTSQGGGRDNSFFGVRLFDLDISGSHNNFFGSSAGIFSQISGNSNSFFGAGSGYKAELTGGPDESKNNTFLGHHSGFQIKMKSGIHNTFIGYRAGSGIDTDNISPPADPNDHRLSRVTNIGNLIITKTGNNNGNASSVENKIYEDHLRDDDVLVKGNLKLCMTDAVSGTADCKPIGINDVPNLKNEISSLKSYICGTNPVPKPSFCP